MTTEQDKKDLLRVKSKQFRCTTLSIQTFYNSYKDGIYDLNPPHQRNIVHGTEWKSNVLQSNIQGLPLGPPEFGKEALPVVRAFSRHFGINELPKTLRPQKYS
jgi:hypothetical protein